MEIHLVTENKFYSEKLSRAYQEFWNFHCELWNVNINHWETWYIILPGLCQKYLSKQTHFSPLSKRNHPSLPPRVISQRFAGGAKKKLMKIKFIKYSYCHIFYCVFSVCERFTSIFPKNWGYDGGPATRSWVGAFSNITDIYTSD